MKHVISVLLENEPCALSRVVGLFSARGYNIETLTVAPTEDATLSRMTIVTTGSDEVIEQITKHLNRLVDVVKVVDLTEGAHIERELMLVKVRAVGKEREEMKRKMCIRDRYCTLRPRDTSSAIRFSSSDIFTSASRMNIRQSLPASARRSAA